MAGMKIDEAGGYARTSDAMMSSKTHTKRVASAEGAGAVSQYEDTNERIVATQKAGDGKIRSKPMKPGYRY